MTLSFCHAPMRRSGPKSTIFMCFTPVFSSNFAPWCYPLLHPPPRRGGGKRWGHAKTSTTQCDARLSARLTQLLCRFDIELEATSMLVNDHAIVAPTRFARNVAGTDIGENPLRIAF